MTARLTLSWGSGGLRKGLVGLYAFVFLLVGCGGERPITVRTKEAEKDAALYGQRVIEIGGEEGLNHTDNPVFIVYGDNRPGWRITELWRDESILLKRWGTPGMVITLPATIVASIPTGLNYVLYRVFALPAFRPVLESPLGSLIRPRSGRDAEERVREAISLELATIDPERRFVVHTGDFVYNGHLDRHFRIFLESNRSLLEREIVFPVLGNHEIGEEGTSQRRYFECFGLPQNYCALFRDVLLIFLDSNVLMNGYDLDESFKYDRHFEEIFFSADPARPSFLQRTLAKYGKEKNHTIVFMHVPLFSFGVPRRYRTENPPPLKERRKVLMQLFAQYEVDVAFFGHDHYYDRLVHVYETPAAEPRELLMVVTGGGGAPLQQPLSQIVIDDRTRHYGEEGFVFERGPTLHGYNFCKVEIGEEHITITAFEASDEGVRVWDEVRGSAELGWKEIGK